MNTEMRELTFDEIDRVSGGDSCNPVPGGMVCTGPLGTSMYFGDTTIDISKNGTITTTTSTHPPRPA